MTIRISGDAPPTGTKVKLRDDQGNVTGLGEVVVRGYGFYGPGSEVHLEILNARDPELYQQAESDEDFYLVIDR